MFYSLWTQYTVGLVFISLTKGDVVKLGNDIVATNFSANVAGNIFLLRDVSVQAEGVLYGFSAFFTNTYPVAFGIWSQDASGGANTYRLRKQWWWTPNVINAREDIYLHLASSQCLRVQVGDKLGLYQPNVPGSVAFEFVPPESLTLRHPFTGNPSTGPSENAAVAFDGLTFPYRFSLAAWVDTDLSKYGTSSTPTCPTQLYIPNNGTVTSPSYAIDLPGGAGATGATGGTGSTGPQGPVGSTGPQGPIGRHGSTGSTGPNGAVGDTGAAGATGHTGSMGPIGATGSVGPQGEMGPQGEKGEKGDPASEASPLTEKYSNCPWCNDLLDAYVVLGLLIWLAILTIVFVIYAIVNSCCGCGRGRGMLGRSRSGGRNTSQDDLWRKYEKKGYNQENHYAEVEEGRTTF